MRLILCLTLLFGLCGGAVADDYASQLGLCEQSFRKFTAHQQCEAQLQKVQKQVALDQYNLKAIQHAQQNLYQREQQLKQSIHQNLKLQDQYRQQLDVCEQELRDCHEFREVRRDRVKFIQRVKVMRQKFQRLQNQDY